MRSVEEILDQCQGPVAVWSGSETIVQAGVVAVAHAQGERRMEALRPAVDQPLAYEGPAAGRPRWTGGIGFAPGDAWSGFPDACFTLPRRQWVWADGALFETTIAAPDVEVPEGGALASSHVDQDDWARMVQAATDAIRGGDVAKVVLARSRCIDAGDPMAAFHALRGLEEGTSFLFQRGATFFGCTPETLVRLQDGRVETHALAGTARNGAAEHLSSADKDILEHELVAAFVRERLVESGIHSIQQSPRRRRDLRHVTHLETPLEGTAPPGTHILDIAARLHPTPAVCGTPRRRSLAIIRELEDVPRGWYAGAVGWFDAQGEGVLNVALRCAHQHGDRRTLFAGAGIVAGSEAQAEWQETEDKLATLRELA